MSSSPTRELERPVKRGRGNPNTQLQREGYSINPGGRRKYDKGAKERMGEVTLEVVEFWIKTMRDPSEEMNHRVRASENIAWGFLGKPSQQVFAAHAHVSFDDVTEGLGDLDALAAAYGAMLGAVEDPGPMIDVTPPRSTRSRALRAPEVDRETESARELEALRRMADEQRAERPRARPRREQQPPPR
jgi:hypothetical protein